FPVWLEVRNSLEAQTGIATGVRECSNNGRQGWLGGGAGQWCGSTVNSICTSLSCSKVGSQLATCSVVGVHVHWQIEFTAQCGDQLGYRSWAKQTSHILNGQDVSARLDD